MSDMTEWLHFYFSLSCIGEGNGNPLQCSCLENPRDGRAWWAAISGVAQSRTQLKWLSHSRMFSSISGFYPLDIKSTSQLRSESVHPSVVHNSSGPHGLYSPPGSSVHGILQARILEWLAIPFTRRSSCRKDWTQVTCTAGRLSSEPPEKPASQYDNQTRFTKHPLGEEKNTNTESCLCLNPSSFSNEFDDLKSLRLSKP